MYKNENKLCKKNRSKTIKAIKKRLNKKYILKLK